MDENYRHCEALVRAADKDGFLATLFAPADRRGPLFALYAFNHEIASIRERAREPMPGEIRLQWWRDAIARAAAGEVIGHPVADAIGSLVGQGALAYASIDGLIEARVFDVAVKIMSDLPALETYLIGTAGALFRLAAQLTSAGGGAPAAESIEPAALGPAAEAAGIAYGLTGVMRALPMHAAKGRVDLPRDALLRHGTTPARLLAGEASEGLSRVLNDLRARARGALGAALPQIAPMPRAAQTAFLPLALVDPYLAALERGDGLQQSVEINPLYRLWRLARYRFRASA
jgi:15-cis-phytoene synthase